MALSVLNTKNVQNSNITIT